MTPTEFNSRTLTIQTALRINTESIVALGPGPHLGATREAANDLFRERYDLFGQFDALSAEYKRDILPAIRGEGQRADDQPEENGRDDAA